MQRAAKGYWKMRPERLRRKAEKVLVLPLLVVTQNVMKRLPSFTHAFKRKAKVKCTQMRGNNEHYHQIR
jgi:hypothetical protein